MSRDKKYSHDLLIIQYQRTIFLETGRFSHLIFQLISHHIAVSSRRIFIALFKTRLNIGYHIFFPFVRCFGFSDLRRYQLLCKHQTLRGFLDISQLLIQSSRCDLVLCINGRQNLLLSNRNHFNQLIKIRNDIRFDLFRLFLHFRPKFLCQAYRFRGLLDPRGQSLNRLHLIFKLLSLRFTTDRVQQQRVKLIQLFLSLLCFHCIQRQHFLNKLASVNNGHFHSCFPAQILNHFLCS
mmetsp:Transcript_26264/g.41663  ORF Transcript_26264/g.41663 Transcript_26264/m.41663 type:complete len:237 (-) Transcript_26264:839-1549(-)